MEDPEYNIENEPEPEITLGGAIAHPLEVAAGQCDLPEGHPVYDFINNLRDCADDIRQLRRLLSTALIALLVMFYLPPEDGGPRTAPVRNPADAYCEATYISPYDGTPQPPIGCPLP